MPEDISRNGSGAGYDAAKTAEAAPSRPPVLPPVPPMEAEWLRAVGGRPNGHAGTTGGGTNGAGPSGAGSNGSSDD